MIKVLLVTFFFLVEELVKMVIWVYIFCKILIWSWERFVEVGREYFDLKEVTE